MAARYASCVRNSSNGCAAEAVHPKQIETGEPPIIPGADDVANDPAQQGFSDRPAGYEIGLIVELLRHCRMIATPPESAKAECGLMDATG